MLSQQFWLKLSDLWVYAEERVFSENYSLLKELVATQRRDNILEEKWMAIL
ncbi:hypothetical protein Gotri_014733 [Gossypium trilobum]|uniref:Uncharacterized protein n=1 Tax=Gossypium trilobum TaxID=34281 RepID=A0A7J9DXX2_9ROSI|nr:hypothetical protein [Gossypium trilobum]